MVPVVCVRCYHHMTTEVGGGPSYDDGGGWMSQWYDESPAFNIFLHNICHAFTGVR